MDLYVRISVLTLNHVGEVNILEEGLVIPLMIGVDSVSRESREKRVYIDVLLDILLGVSIQRFPLGNHIPFPTRDGKTRKA